jgi:hypothetical protein
MSPFGKIFVVNLDNPIGMARLLRIGSHFREQNIEFERWDATYNDNGAIGLTWTYMRLFVHCIKNGWSNVVVFEDDCRIVVPSLYDFIKEVWPQVPADYHCLYLGINLNSIPTRYSENILKIQSGYASHAIVYSFEAMKFIVEAIKNNPFETYDLLLMRTIQKEGKCFATFPQVCFQRPGISHIAKDFKDWTKVSAASFQTYTKDI